MGKVVGEFIPVSSLLENITNSSDWNEKTFGRGFDWNNIIEHFVTDDYHAPRMAKLIESVSVKGFLAEGAINVYKDGYRKCSSVIFGGDARGCTCWVCERPKGWELANGHHRFATALLLGLDEIPVVFDKLTWPDHLWEEEITRPDHLLEEEIR